MVKDAFKGTVKDALKLSRRLMVQFSLKEKFFCPICNYYGPFLDVVCAAGPRKNAKCPKCESYERHRLQKLVIDKLAKKLNFSKMSLLHMAPEKFFRNLFNNSFKKYVTADLNQQDVDYIADLRMLPFDDNEFDFVFASHVLEHIKEDLTAISEIRRVLRPGGVALLQVPIVSEKTIEYGEPNWKESGHVRAPGFDYYDRFDFFFSKVEKYSSNDSPEKYQTYIYERRDLWPTLKLPLRRPMYGEKHLSVVPVCFA